MVEVSLTAFRILLVLKWRTGWAGVASVAAAAGVGRFLSFSMAVLKPRACKSVVKRSVSYGNGNHG